MYQVCCCLPDDTIYVLRMLFKKEHSRQAEANSAPSLENASHTQ
jgi:hypothetical protein